MNWTHFHGVLVLSFLLLSGSALAEIMIEADFQQDSTHTESSSAMPVRKGRGNGQGNGAGRGDGSGGRDGLFKGSSLSQTKPDSITVDSLIKNIRQESSRKYELDSVKIQNLLALARSYHYISPDSLIIVAKEAQQLSDKGKYVKGSIESRKLMSIAYANSHRYSSSNKLANEIFAFANSDSSNIPSVVLYTIANNYHEMDEKQQAEMYYLKSIDFNKKKGDTLYLLYASIELSLLYERTGEFKKAINIGLKALKIAKEIENYVAVYTLQTIIGNAYSSLGQFETALNYLNAAVRLRYEHYRPVSVAFGYYHLQNAYAKEGRYEESIEYGRKVLDVLNRNPGTYLLMLSMLSSEEAYSALSRKMPPFSEISKSQLASISIDHEWLMNQRQLEGLFNAEKTDDFISFQESEIGFLAEKTRFQQQLIWSISIGLVLLFGMALLYRSRAFALKEAQIQKAFSHKLLKFQEDERQRISRDLHDSVGQSLILIKNKIQLNDNAETTSLITNTLEEVRSISKQLHPILLEKVGLTASIEKLISDADASTEIFMESDIDDINNILPKEQELHVYRIMQEVLNNMIKHSQSSSAFIEVKDSPNQIKCSIIDHGTGFDLTENPGQFQSLGMLTLKERTKILNGILVIDSTKGKGTSLVLTIPKPANYG
jgi:signal transduction histidine kinase